MIILCLGKCNSVLLAIPLHGSQPGRPLTLQRGVTGTARIQ